MPKTLSPLKAMVFAAGLGTRLRPLTDSTPKGLVQVGGKTMLQLVTEKLINAGVKQIVINVHHHAGQMKNIIAQMKHPGVQFFISDETDLLLDTGGGLMHARQWLEGEQPFFIYNVDVLSDIDLNAMLAIHKQNNALVTLAVSDRKTSRYLLVDNHNHLSGWENTITGETILCRQDAEKHMKQRAFSGIHLVDPAIFKLIHQEDSFPILPQYLNLAKEHDIQCFEHDPQRWADIGTLQKLQSARQLFDQHPGLFL